MKYLFGTFFLIWLAGATFRKLPTIWAYFIATLEFIGKSITTPASTADDNQGVSSVFDDDFRCSICGNLICTCHEMSHCTTCGNMICSCHTNSLDDPFRDDSISSSSLFDD